MAEAEAEGKTAGGGAERDNERDVRQLINSRVQTVRVRSLEGYLEGKGPRLILELSLA